jgi:hypothetical protein
MQLKCLDIQISFEDKDNITQQVGQLKFFVAVMPQLFYLLVYGLFSST